MSAHIQDTQNTQKLGFFTPIAYSEIDGAGQKENCSFLRFTENYLTLSGRRVKIVERVPLVNNGNTFNCENTNQDHSNFLVTTLKVISYATIILPLLALIGKAIYRWSNDFQLVQENVDSLNNTSTNSTVDSKKSSNDKTDKLAEAQEPSDELKHLTNDDLVEKLVAIQDSENNPTTIQNTNNRIFSEELVMRALKLYKTEDFDNTLELTDKIKKSLQNYLNNNLDFKDWIYFIRSITLFKKGSTSNKNSTDKVYGNLQNIRTKSNIDENELSNSALYNSEFFKNYTINLNNQIKTQIKNNQKNQARMGWDFLRALDHDMTKDIHFPDDQEYSSDEDKT